jgi:hypothetical protein
MNLILFTALDEPHGVSDDPWSTRCGRPIGKGAQVVTPNQALVHLDDRRCKTCFPHHVPHRLKGIGRG